jgi:DNA-binding LytR/AlgR family response regulator
LLKCIIVEDEVLAQDVLKSHLARLGSLELVGVYRNALEAEAALKNQDVDIMFLDIRLPGMSGLQFLSGLKESPLVVLTTAYAEYALESYEFNVIDYLLKPISFDRFSRAISKVLDNRIFSPAAKEADPFSDDHIFIRSNNKFLRVSFAEILYIQGSRDYLKIHTPDYSLITHQTMNDIEKTLPSRQFIRVHKSYIVALRHIRSIYGNSIELGKTTIPIGVSYKDSVMSLIGRKS